MRGSVSIGRILELERAVEEAKIALSDAEVTMSSVRAGLALEPLPTSMPTALKRGVVAGPTIVEMTWTWFASGLQELDPRRSPVLIAHALGLVLIGWTLAYALIPMLGQERAREIGRAMRSPFAGLRGVRSSFEAPVRATIQADARDVLASAEPPVIIFERTSPYPQFFNSTTARDMHCLSEAIYYEARGEPVAGQIAVAQVVLNRTLAGPWPRTICGVTSQGVENGEKCQFSFACQRSILTKPNGDAWSNAQGLAEEILAGGAWLEEMLDATHFHRIDLQPVWRLGLLQIGRYGRHLFYSSPTENRRPLSTLASR